jgi:hypothetical protein
MIKIERSLVCCFSEISIDNLRRVFMSSLRSSRSWSLDYYGCISCVDCFIMWASGTGNPFSISFCSMFDWDFMSAFKVAPLSAIISNRSLVIALRLPKARNHTLPLTCSGMPYIQSSLTRLERLTLSQLGMISRSHTLSWLCSIKVRLLLIFNMSNPILMSQFTHFIGVDFSLGSARLQ